MLARLVFGSSLVGLGLLGCSDGAETCSGANCASAGSAGVAAVAGTNNGGQGGSLGSSGSTAGGTGGLGGVSSGGGGASNGGSSTGGGGGGGSGGTGIGDPSAPAGSPVYINGKLSVVGKELHNQSGQVVQLKGIS